MLLQLYCVFIIFKHVWIIEIVTCNSSHYIRWHGEDDAGFFYALWNIADNVSNRSHSVFAIANLLIMNNEPYLLKPYATHDK